MIELYKLLLNTNNIPLIDRHINKNLRYAYNGPYRNQFLYLLKFRRDSRWVGGIYEFQLYTDRESRKEIEVVYKYLLNKYGTKLQ